DPSASTGTKIGQGKGSISLGPTAVENHTTITGISGTATTNLLIQVTVNFVDTGNENTVHYDSTATPSSFTVNNSTATPTPSVSASATATPVTGPTGPQKFDDYNGPIPLPHNFMGTGVG